MGSERFSLEGRVAFVTGASRGLGRAIAAELAEHGADVALVARSAEGLEATARDVAGHGRRALVLPCDVTLAPQVEEAVGRTIEGLGGLDVIVNNAGGSRFLSPLIGVREEGWDKALAVNLKAAFLVCRAAGSHLLNQQRGSVVNIASVAGVRGAPLLSFYAAAKGGLLQLTRTLAREWAPLGVRVNAISPGDIATGIWGPLAGDPNFVEMTLREIPMGRWGTPEEVAAAAVFLASDAASYVTGANLVVDGGMTA